jgi:hypothetical protein
MFPKSCPHRQSRMDEDTENCLTTGGEKGLCGIAEVCWWWERTVMPEASWRLIRQVRAMSTLGAQPKEEAEGQHYG